MVSSGITLSVQPNLKTWDRTESSVHFYESFRKILFWMHLDSGLLAGVIIFIMCVTGALLAFERQIIEYSERDARFVTVSGGDKLAPQLIVEKLREARPDSKPTALSITNEPGAAWLFNLGREGQVYVDPYTGAINGEGNKSVRGAMTELRNWHRYASRLRQFGAFIRQCCPIATIPRRSAGLPTALKSGA